MCGRIASYSPPEHFARAARAVLSADARRSRSSYNVPPTRTVCAALSPEQLDPELLAELVDPPEGEELTRVLVGMRWGLIPHWAKAGRTRQTMINARAESVTTKPSYRHLVSKRRCVVMADGFFEWHGAPGSRSSAKRTPWYFSRADGEPLALAGLWSPWRPEEGPEAERPEAGGGLAGPVRTCTVITTEAGPDVAPVHERMPVILAGEQLDAWLDPSLTDLEVCRGLLVPSPAGTLDAHVVGMEVNTPRHDGPELILPRDHEPPTPER